MLMEMEKGGARIKTRPINEVEGLVNINAVTVDFV